MTFTIIETKTVPTIQAVFNHKRMILHSKYDPLREARVWCDKEADRVKTDEPILVIGLGAGYHIQELATRYPQNEINVVEFNDSFYKWFHNSPFYRELQKHQSVTIQHFSELSTTERNDIFSTVSITNLLIHKSGLDLLPKEFEGVRNALEDIIMQKNSLRHQLDHLKINFKKNSLLGDESIAELKNHYKGKPMILVSAGPSLDQQLPLLKQIRNEKHFIIGAVGTAVKPLLNANITPDFFMIIDPNEGTYGQLTNVSLPTTPLFYLSTAYHDTIRLHAGPRKIIFQQGFGDAEKQAVIMKEPLIQTGGSVATALLDLMVYLGGKSIAVIGQDLAYTKGKTHATGSHDEKMITGVQKTLNYYRTGEIETANNLNLYRKWFERYALNQPDINFYNCTEGGAYIENWRHLPFKTFYEKYS